MAYNVKFLKGSLDNFNAIVTKDKNTFYFIDEKDLYLGDIKLSNQADIADAVDKIALNEQAIKDLQAELDALVDPEGTGGGSISTQISNLRTELLNRIDDNADAIKAEEERAKKAESDLQQSIDDVDSDLTTLAGTVDTHSTSINDLSGQVGQLSQNMNNHLTDYRNLKDDVTELTGTVTDLGSTVSGHTTQLATLVGEDADKSIRAIAAEELAVQLVPETAQESLDTLQEIAAWIQSHPGDVATINASIKSLEELTADHTASLEDLASQLEDILDAEDGLLAQAKNHTDFEVAKLQEQISNNDKDIEALQTLTGNHTAAINAINDAETGILAQAEGKIAEALRDLGLGSAAYKNVEDFDAAGSAAAALSEAKTYTDTALTWEVMTNN